MTEKNNHKRKIWWLIATWFGSGLSPKASGTAGSLAALPFAFVIQYYGGNSALFWSAVAMFFVGWWASCEYLKHTGRDDDPKEIVVDEVAGMWLTIAILIPFVLMPLFEIIYTPHPTEYYSADYYEQYAPSNLISSIPIQVTFIYYFISFIGFRFFDAIKPWPISVADRKIKGGFGVMFDDILAAIYTIILIALFVYVYANLITH